MRPFSDDHIPLLWLLRKTLVTIFRAENHAVRRESQVLYTAELLMYIFINGIRCWAAVDSGGL